MPVSVMQRNRQISLSVLVFPLVQNFFQTLLCGSNLLLFASVLQLQFTKSDPTKGTINMTTVDS